jgi:hypothetical protein
MPMKFDGASYNQWDVSCEHCGNAYVNHVAVDIHVRAQEDAPTVSYRVYDSHRQGRSSPPMTKNPSSRRDGVAVTMACENCPGFTVLTLEQHKGNTFVDLQKLSG